MLFSTRNLRKHCRMCLTVKSPRDSTVGVVLPQKDDGSTLRSFCGEPRRLESVLAWSSLVVLRRRPEASRRYLRSSVTGPLLFAIIGILLGNARAQDNSSVGQ